MVRRLPPHPPRAPPTTTLPACCRVPTCRAAALPAPAPCPRRPHGTTQLRRFARARAACPTRCLPRCFAHLCCCPRYHLPPGSTVRLRAPRRHTRTARILRTRTRTTPPAATPPAAATRLPLPPPARPHFVYLPPPCHCRAVQRRLPPRACRTFGLQPFCFCCLPPAPRLRAHRRMARALLRAHFARCACRCRARRRAAACRAPMPPMPGVLMPCHHAATFSPRTHCRFAFTTRAAAHLHHRCRALLCLFPPRCTLHHCRPVAPPTYPPTRPRTAPPAWFVRVARAARAPTPPSHPPRPSPTYPAPYRVWFPIPVHFGSFHAQPVPILPTYLPTYLLPTQFPQPYPGLRFVQFLCLCRSFAFALPFSSFVPFGSFLPLPFVLLLLLF